MSNFEVNAFYRFMILEQYQSLREPLQDLCKRLQLRGILLIAMEGVNGTICGAPEAMAQFRHELKQICGLDQLDVRVSFAPKIPFLRMKVRLKAEIVTLGVPGVDPLRKVGKYVAPENWNALILDPEVTLIDARNDFEVGLGSFTGAIDPKTSAFSDLPSFIAHNLHPDKNRKVAMFCTGGIRCEKATSYMLDQGFNEVYHLQGGILKYLEQVPPEDSLWHGACFVFDERVGIENGMKITDLTLCYGCRAPLNADDRASAQFERGVSCPHCQGLLTAEQKASSRERQKQVDLANRRGDAHLGPRALVGS